MSIVLPSGYISPRCSVDDHNRCPDNPWSEMHPPAGPHACACGCNHGQPAGPRLPAAAFG